MSEEIQCSKIEVRKMCLNQRRALGQQERKCKSKIIQQRLLDLQEFQKAKAVLLFLDFSDEVETLVLAEAALSLEKRLILPRCAPYGILIPIEVHNLMEDLELGTYGIREPKLTLEVEILAIDLVIVPGTGFDLQGNRLGYGGGFYDRFFMNLNPLIPRVALCFECQVISQVPVEKHDAKMTMLITDNEVYIFEL